MRRRKLLISIGALAGGGTAAFGTEAFTSIQAERSVDVSVAGDQSAYLALTPADGQNAAEYVSTSGGTLSVTLDSVNQNAVTTVDDLFTLVNQGSQPVYVYFEDASDVVSFRKSGTAQSLEGTANAVELTVGGTLTVGLEVDTTSGSFDDGDSLLDRVQLYATSTDPVVEAPTQALPDLIVDGVGDSPSTFATVSAALSSASAGDKIGVDPAGGPYDVTSAISVDTPVTLTGYKGRPTIDGSGVTPSGGLIQVATTGVTLQNFELKYSGANGVNAIEANQPSVRDLTVDDLRVVNEGTISGSPAINLEKIDEFAVTNNDIEGGAIGVYYTSTDETAGVITGNYINANPTSGSVTEGIFVFDGSDQLQYKDLTIRDNTVENSGSDSRDIKVGPSNTLPNSLNGVGSGAGAEDQLDALLNDNDVYSAKLLDNFASKVSADSTYATTIQGAIDAAEIGEYVFVEPGTYEESLDISKSDFTLRGAGETEVVVDASDAGEYGLDVSADGVTLEEFTLKGPINPSGGYASGYFGVKISDVTGIHLANVTVEGSATSEIDLNGVTDAVLENVTADGQNPNEPTTSGTGLFLTNCRNVRLENVTTLNNEWAGIAVSAWDKSSYPTQPRAREIELVGDANTIREDLPLYTEEQPGGTEFHLSTGARDSTVDTGGTSDWDVRFPLDGSESGHDVTEGTVDRGSGVSGNLTHTAVIRRYPVVSDGAGGYELGSPGQLTEQYFASSSDRSNVVSSPRFVQSAAVGDSPPDGITGGFVYEVVNTYDGI